MEDERTQHPLVQVKPVDFKPLPAALKCVPEARVMVLNANRAMSMTALQASNVTIDIAMLEGVGGVENLLKDWPLEQLVFGSHAPLFYFESAKLKLQESELTEKQLTAITHENAQRLLAVRVAHETSRKARKVEQSDLHASLTTAFSPHPFLFMLFRVFRGPPSLSLSRPFPRRLPKPPQQPSRRCTASRCSSSPRSRSSPIPSPSPMTRTAAPTCAR